MSLDEVLQRLLAVARDRVLPEVEKVDTFDSLGRVLARGVVSALDVPPASVLAPPQAAAVSNRVAAAATAARDFRENIGGPFTTGTGSERVGRWIETFDVCG